MYISGVTETVRLNPGSQYSEHGLNGPTGHKSRGPRDKGNPQSANLDLKSQNYQKEPKHVPKPENYQKETKKNQKRVPGSCSGRCPNSGLNLAQHQHQNLFSPILSTNTNHQTYMGQCQHWITSSSAAEGPPDQDGPLKPQVHYVCQLVKHNLISCRI